MFQYFIRRLLLMIPTFIACTLVVFLFIELTPGGPFEMAMMQAQQRAQGEAGSGGSGGRGEVQIPEEAKQALREYFQLDKPVPVRYVNWLGKVMTGDFGTSYRYGQPAIDVITSRFPVSLYFGIIGFILTYIVCIPLGIIKAVRHNGTFDISSSLIVFVGYAIPVVALGSLLRVFLGRKLGWFPISDFRSEDWDMLSSGEQIIDQIKHTILPLICYMIGSFATLTVLMKNSLMENLGQDYVRTAFAKGLSEKRVLFVHALRNSLIPIVTGLGHAFGILLAGSLFIEQIFNIQGIGLLQYQVILNRDLTVFMAITVIGVVIQLTGNIISDFLYALIDPRIRFS